MGVASGWKQSAINMKAMFYDKKSPYKALVMVIFYQTKRLAMRNFLTLLLMESAS